MRLSINKLTKKTKHFLNNKILFFGGGKMASKNENVLISKLLGRDIISLNQDNTIYDAINLLAKNNIGALPVVKNQKILYGIISERDIIC